MKLVESKKRFFYIDVLKSLSIILVIIFHIRIMNYNLLEEFNVDRVLSYMLYNILPIAPPLFFLINGFLTFEKNKDVTWAINKSINLLKISLIWMVVYYLFILIGTGEYKGFFDFLSVLFGYKYATYSSLWFIICLFGIYLIAPFLYMMWEYNKQYLLYFSLIIFALSFGNTFLKDFFNILSTYKDGKLAFGTLEQSMYQPFASISEINFGSMLIYYVTGGVLSKNQCEIKKVTKFQLTIALTISLSISFMISLLISYYSNEMYTNAFGNYQSVFIFIAVISIFLLFSKLKLRSFGFINIIGANTLGIYLFHRLVIEVLRKIDYFTSVLKLFKYGIIQTIIYALLVLGISLLLTLLVKKIPLLKRILMF